MPNASWCRTLFVNTADATAFNTSASEGTIIAGLHGQPTLPARFFHQDEGGKGKSIGYRLAGIIGTTGTPTIIYQVRISTTQGTSTLSGSSLAVSAAITTINNSSNAMWVLEGEVTCYTPGQGSGNTTLTSWGEVRSPIGFASTYIYPLEVTTPATATWTQTADSALTYYMNFSVTWSASSASNTITTKSIKVWEWN